MSVVGWQLSELYVLQGYQPVDAYNESSTGMVGTPNQWEKGNANAAYLVSNVCWVGHPDRITARPSRLIDGSQRPRLAALCPSLLLQPLIRGSLQICAVDCSQQRLVNGAKRSTVTLD